MERYRNFFTSVAVTGLACALLTGSALALPAPSLQFDPAADQVQASASAQPMTLAMTSATKTGFGSRASELSLSSSTPQNQI